jgi:hypothetical protein
MQEALMKRRYITPFTLPAIVILIGLQTGGCQGSKRNFLDSKDRVVTISSVTPGNSNPCEVDFPVTLLEKGKNHSITWFADDSDYWIVFVGTGGFDNPIGIVGKKLTIQKQHSAGPYYVQLVPAPSTPPTNPIYFKYAIYNADPDGPTRPVACKDADNERDTGLNVKP